MMPTRSGCLSTFLLLDDNGQGPKTNADLHGHTQEEHKALSLKPKLTFKMVNPLMSSKQEPFSGISDVLGVGTSSASVKLELNDPSENGDDEDNKIEVKMEVLEEFFGLGFGGNIIETDSL